MKIAFSTNAYRKYSIKDSINSISRAGYSAIELMCDEPHAFPPVNEQKITTIKNTLNEKNMEISNLNGFMMNAIQDFHHPSWIEPQKEKRILRIEHTKKCIELAKTLNVKTVSTEPGGPITKSSSRKNDLKIFSDGINEVIPVAEKNKVKLLIEPEPDLLIENSSQYVDFISNFDTKYLGMNFDIGHFFCVNEKPEEVLVELKEFIHHIHLEDIAESRIHKHLIPGTGSINFKKIFQAINEIDYEGYITIELYPYQSNPEEAAKKALKFIKQQLEND